MNKIPINIGVIGHRDIHFTNEHQEVIRKLLNDINTKYPKSPIKLFSQLAIGADTHVAKVFLDVKQNTSRNYELIVPLPYDLHYYKKNQFSTETELQTFESLLAQSERYFKINSISDKGKKTLDIDNKAHLEELNEYYRKGGEFIADSSIILIALWDMVDNHLEGGTANTVFYKKNGAYKKFISEHIFDTQGSLIVIPCNRNNQHKTLSFEQSTLQKLLKDESIKKALNKIEELNVNIKNVDNAIFNKNADYLFSSENKIDKNSMQLRMFFSISDTLAVTNQKKYSLLLKALFILGFIIFGFFEAYKHLGLNNALFGITIGLIVFAFGIFKLSFNWKNHKKYIENRVLSEALRVQFFWHLSNIKEAVSNYILRIHKKEYNWISHILSSIYGLTFYTDKKSISTQLIRENWIENQKNYFSKNVKKIEKKEKQHNYISYAMFGLGVILLFGIFYFNKKEELHQYLHWLIVLDSIVFGVFALVKAYYEKRGYEQVKTQYELMRDIYTASSNKLNELEKTKSDEDNRKISNILFLTGKEAVVENGNWYMIYKDKKPEVEGIG